MPGEALLIDRLLGQLGARRLCQLRPGMGWMLAELTPPAFWIACTGAMILGPGSYYFNEFLKYAGASQQQLGAVPLLYAIALILATAWNLRRRHSDDDPRRSCLASCWWGRCLWLLIPCVPWLVPEGLWRLTAFAVLILGVQTILVAGMGAWASWTQRLVPNRHRPAFFAYRHLMSAAIILPSMAGLKAIWADGEALFGAQGWLQVVFLGAGLIAVLGTLPLQWAPRMPQRTDHRNSTNALAIGHALRQAHGVRAFYLWSFLATAGVGLLTIYLPEMLKNSGLDTETNLQLDIWLRTPAMITATLFGPMLARWLGHVAPIALIQLLTLISLGSAFCWHSDSSVLWLWLSAGSDGLWRGLTTVVVFSYLQKLMPSPDRRLPALFLAAGGMGQGLAALVPLLFWQSFGSPETAARAMCWIAFACATASIPVLMWAKATRKTSA